MHCKSARRKYIIYSISHYHLITEFLHLIKHFIFCVACSLEFKCVLLNTLDFPGCSDGKESACNAGDLDLIPGLGRFPGGGHGNPL